MVQRAILSGRGDRMGSSRKKPTPGNQPRCDVCRSQSFAESTVSCERCITVQHTFCLPEPLVGLPDRWLCPACSESSLRHYPSRRRRRSNSSAGSGDAREGPGGGNGNRHRQPSSRAPSDAPQTNDADVNGSTRSKRGSASVVGAGETPSAGNKRARRSADNGGALPAAEAEASKEAARTAAEQDAGMRGECPEKSHRPNDPPADTEREESLDLGSTVTLFCRRDFRRYLRWKRRELASQDDERRKEEQTRARKTLSSIVASSR